METLPAIPILEHEPREVMEEVVKVANALKDVVVKAGLSKNFGGDKNHLYYEAWQTVGGFFSHSVKTLEAVPVEIDGVKGMKARAILYNRDGKEIGGAEAYCMRDERNWANKPLYQLSSMAQTRAGSKAFRNKFAWVAVLGGYAGTPAEEMDGVVQENGKDVDMEAMQKRSEALCAELHDKLVASDSLTSLKGIWAKINQVRQDLMPEHFSILESLKNEQKQKMEVK